MRTPGKLKLRNGNSRVIGKGKRLRMVEEIKEEDRMQRTDLRSTVEDGSPAGSFMKPGKP